jgi:amino acid permease
MGRPSIFIINGLIAFNCVLMLMVYHIVFGSSVSTIMQDAFNNTSSFFVSKAFYIIVIGLLNLPLILKRAIKELKFASWLLFGAILLFILILTIQLIIKGTYMNPDSSYSSYYSVNLTVAISVIFTAYGF